MLLTAVHIDDNEVTNDSVFSHVSSSKNYKLVKLYGRSVTNLRSYHSDFTIVII